MLVWSATAVYTWDARPSKSGLVTAIDHLHGTLSEQLLPVTSVSTVAAIFPSNVGPSYTTTFTGAFSLAVPENVGVVTFEEGVGAFRSTVGTPATSNGLLHEAAAFPMLLFCVTTSL